MCDRIWVCMWVCEYKYKCEWVSVCVSVSVCVCVCVCVCVRVWVNFSTHIRMQSFPTCVGSFTSLSLFHITWFYSNSGYHCLFYSCSSFSISLAPTLILSHSHSTTLSLTLTLHSHYPYSITHSPSPPPQRWMRSTGKVNASEHSQRLHDTYPTWKWHGQTSCTFALYRWILCVPLNMFMPMFNFPSALKSRHHSYHYTLFESLKPL